MFRIVIVEDNETERTRMSEYVKKYASGRGLEIELRQFSDGKYLLDEYPAQTDLILLDIDMEFLSGIETARRVRSFDTNVQILFVTRMVQYALEGYEVDAADFIVKPLPYEQFAVKMDRVMKKIRLSRPRFMKVICGKEERLLRIQQILCIEALNKKTIIHLENGTDLETSQSLKVFEKALAEELFFRCHNAFLVNMTYVQSFSASDVHLPGHVVPVSKYRKREFLQALTGFRGQML